MKVLLVEDTRAVAAVMAARLSSFGFEVLLAENGEIAVAKFRAEAPDLVLMDIDMPVMNGFEATNRIRAFEATQQWAWTPVLFLTASDTSENLVTAIEAGGDDFLAKTLPEDVLRAKMKAMTRIADMRRRLSVANRKLENLANLDGLTGLCNRRSMDRRVDAAWVTCRDAGQPFGLLMIDVDNFKKYNDHYGHQAGDDCLKAVAAALDHVAADTAAGPVPQAFAARYGGEEFAVVLPGATPARAEQLAAAAVAAVHALEIPHELNTSYQVVTISVGVSGMDPATGEIGSVFRAADRALYRAKDGGRNRYKIAAAEN